MAKIVLEFEVDDGALPLLLGVLQGKKLPSWVGAPPDAEALQADAEADARDARIVEDEAPEPAPEPKRRNARTPRVSAAPAPAPEAPVPAPPAPAPEPPVSVPEPPPLDMLKQTVTSAVRLAQKGEGSGKILDLLPDFKDRTGLAFVMNAEDKHRTALYDLVLAAGLPVI